VFYAIIVLGVIGAAVLSSRAALLLRDWLSHWRVLAKRFGFSGSFDGPLIQGATAYIGPVRMSEHLVIGLSATHVYIAPATLRRSSRRPILVPWSALYVQMVESGFPRGAQLAFREGPVRPITLQGVAAEQVRALLPSIRTAQQRSDEDTSRRDTE